MSFAFKRRKSVAHGWKRLTSAGVENAFRCMAKPDKAKAIHGVRKEIKKLRALIRLVEESLSRKEGRWLKKKLRRAARYLGSPRDAHVRVQTMNHLCRSFKAQLNLGALWSVRRELRRRCENEVQIFKKQKIQRKVASLLRQTERKTADARLRRGGWKVLGPGVKGSYRAACSAFEAAVVDGSVANLHEWRKRAKDLGYHVRLLHRIWPEQMDAMENELETLTTYLGDDHDLTMLHETLTEPGFGKACHQTIEVLVGVIAAQRTKPQSAAMTLGKRFFSDRSEEFSNRIHRYWRKWRRESDLPRIGEPNFKSPRPRLRGCL